MVETLMDLCETHIIGEHSREWVCQGPSFAILKEHGFLHVGRSDVSAPYRMVRHGPEVLHVLACTGGEGQVLIDGKWQRAGRGTIYISPPKTPVAFQAIPGRRWQFAWIYFDRDSSETRRLSGQPSFVIPADANLLDTAITGFYQESLGFADKAILICQARLIFLTATRLLRPPGTVLRLAALWQEVANDLTRPWSVPLLCERAGVGEEQLRRLCHAETGRSPMRHVTMLRLDRAKMLLQTTSLQIGAISELVGYADPFAFSTAFKRHFGESPSSYLKTI